MEKAVDATVAKMDAQLKVCGAMIDDLAAKVQKVQTKARSDLHSRIDELKVIRAVAQSKLDEFRAAGDIERASIKEDLESAWDDLDTVLKHVKPKRPPAGSTGGTDR